MISGPRDPENRVRRAILRRLVVGELRRMIFKRFYAELRDGVGHQNPLALTINAELPGSAKKTPVGPFKGLKNQRDKEIKRLEIIVNIIRYNGKSSYNL